jgi:hypothetical protein
MKSREVYLASTRVYVACIVAQVAAAGLFVGVLGSIFTWDHHSAVFDLANSPHGISKPELGYLFGPALILIALPLVRHRRPHVAYAGHYRARLGAAMALWVVGLALLLSHLAGLDGEYTLQFGAYVATALISIGLVATLAMWPAGLGTGLFDRRGGVEVPAADGPDVA